MNMHTSPIPPVKIERPRGPFTPKEIDKLPAGKYRQAPALWVKVVVAASGKRKTQWLYRYTYVQPDGVRIEAAPVIGLWPAMTIAAATAEVERLAALRDGGVLPSNKAAPATPKGSIPTFRAMALEWYDLRKLTCGNAKHAAQIWSTLETYAMPWIGDKLVTEITSDDVAALLNRNGLWFSKNETMDRTRSRIKMIFDHARIRKFVTDNPATVDVLPLPKAANVQAVTNHPALPWDRMGAFMRDLRARPGTSARAMEWLIRSSARSNAVTGARWQEIDRKEMIWTVPASRMKATVQKKEPFRFPITRQMLSILDHQEKRRHPLEPKSKEDFIFPSETSGNQMTSDALSRLLTRMGIAPDDAVPHGFRSTFGTWADAAGLDDYLIERALQHSPKGIRKVYRRSDMLEPRRALMQRYSDALDAEAAKATPDA